MSVLDRILAVTRDRVVHMTVPEPALPARARQRFGDALRNGGPRVIAEIKPVSPSAGPLLGAADPALLAQEYARNGATAISVLTEPDFFGGSMELFRAVRSATDLPLIMKDFIIDPIQLLVARAVGADAVLLIASVLAATQLRELLHRARDLGLDVLVEIHERRELETALDAGADIVGINNRDLHTLRTDLDVTRRLAPLVPANVTLVSESGIRSRTDVDEVAAAGCHAVLVGTHLMQSANPGAALAELTAAGTRVKVCGVTSPDDARQAAAIGARMVGMILAPGTPRSVDMTTAVAIAGATPAGTLRVGVFRNACFADIRAVLEQVPLDLVQLHGDEPAALVDRLGAECVICAHPVPGDTPLTTAAYALADRPKGGSHPPIRCHELGDTLAGHPRLIIAGSLTSDSVGDAVAGIGPFAVDVCRGVETSPGVKCLDRLAAFMAAVQNADALARPSGVHS